VLSFSDFPCWTCFSAEKQGYLQVSTGHLPRAAFQVQQQNWDQIAKKNTTRLGGVLFVIRVRKRTGQKTEKYLVFN